MGFGVRYDGSVTVSAKNVPVGTKAPLFTEPYATVTVYTDGTLTELATCWGDQALTENGPNPMMSDAEGRFGFWINQGNYVYTVASAIGVLLGTYNLTLTAGAVGPGATVNIGAVSTGLPGSVATVTNLGSATAAVFDFSIPTGLTGSQGPAATIAVGTLTTGAPGSAVSVTNSGTSGAAILNFTIPAGQTGEPGASSISLPLYATAAAGVVSGTGVSANGYFYIPSANIDGENDLYQNVSGAAIYQGTVPSLSLLSDGRIFVVRDPQGFELSVISLSPTSGLPIITFIEPRMLTIESNVASNTAAIIALKEGGGGGTTVLTPADSYPIAGSSSYNLGGIESVAFDTANIMIPYVPPNDSCDFQPVFSNVTGLSENQSGPIYTITSCTLEDSSGTIHPVFFNNGESTATLAPFGRVIADKVSCDVLAGKIFYIHAQMVLAAGSTVGFVANWQAGFAHGTAAFAPNTNSKGTGNQFEAIELLRTRTVNDIVTIAGSATITSASAAFTAQEVNQKITISGAGAEGAELVTTYSFVSATTAILATVATTAGSDLTGNISASIKTGGTIPYYYGYVGFGPSPLTVLGRNLITPASVMVGIDSITQGLGATQFPGDSWSVLGLSPGRALSLAATFNPQHPFINVGMSGESVENFLAHHDSRLALASQCKYFIGLGGTNDLVAGVTDTQLEDILVLLMRAIQRRGCTQFWATLLPRTTSTDGWVTTANQTVLASEPFRLNFNAWLRDGAPIDSTTLLPVAVGTSAGTSLRAAYYSETGAIINPASGSSLHPCTGGVIETADTLESAHNSGFWGNDSGAARTADGIHPVQSAHLKMGVPVSGLILNGILI